MLAGVHQQLLTAGAQARGETAAALMNCGRLPMTVRTLQRRVQVSARRTITAADAAMSCSEAHSRTEWYS